MKSYIKFIKEANVNFENYDSYFNMCFGSNCNELTIVFNMIDHPWYLFFLNDDEMIFLLDNGYEKKEDNQIVFNHNIWHNFINRYKITDSKSVADIFNYFSKKYTNLDYESCWSIESNYEIKYSNH